ncbi:MAG: C15orf41 family protein [Candidatus Thermoplasmatota archaeon]
MKYSEYKELYEHLQTPEDIDFLAENFGYDKELLLVIYTQRVVRDTTKRFYRVKEQAKKMAWAWQHGHSFVEVADRFHFPPILAALMILEQRKISLKQFWKMLGDLSKVPEHRLARDLAQACRTDIVYSPEGSARQYARGRWGESKLQAWLNARGLEYRTEKDLRPEYDKTPDILLRTPVELNGSKKYWIESKATFGDPHEIRRHIKKQLGPYTDLFGDGVVVYWFGFVEDVELPMPEGVTVLDANYFESPPVPYDYVPLNSERAVAHRPIRSAEVDFAD